MEDAMMMMVTMKRLSPMLLIQQISDIPNILRLRLGLAISSYWFLQYASWRSHAIFPCASGPARSTGSARCASVMIQQWVSPQKQMPVPALATALANATPCGIAYFYSPCRASKFQAALAHILQG